MANDSISEDSTSSPETSNTDSKKKFFPERAVNHQRNASLFLYNFLTVTKTNLILVNLLFYSRPSRSVPEIFRLTTNLCKSCNFATNSV